MRLWQQVILALVSGVMFGIFFPDYVGYVKPIGTLFMRLIKMVIVPMIFFSLVSGITSMSDPASLGRVGLKATIAFMITTCCAVLFGLLVAIIIQPGKGVHIDFGQHQSHITPKFYLEDFLIEIVPENVVRAFAENNVLQVVFFAIFTGVCLNHLGSSVAPVRTFCHSASKLVLRMITMIISLSPYGAFALIAWLVRSQGMGVLLTLSKLVGAVVIAMIIQYGIFGLLIAVLCNISPLPFYRKSVPYQLIAFSTSSSKASLPTTMEICKEELGISDSSASFILPLGAAINMDGLAINLGLTALFFAQVAGVDLSYVDYMMIIITATLGSVGGAGIPGASLIMLPMVLSSVNLPIEGVAILAGIDRILDTLRTTINITGDATITLIIDYSEGTFDKDKYYS
ncbi:MAG: dicarboxylate/amino acid:cation symporter [Alphaproteobacteria bacterium]|nr:dicarboxylate/amino acid:cation symporter [Alphaproteobacteria bacterium]